MNLRTLRAYAVAVAVAGAAAGPPAPTAAAVQPEPPLRLSIDRLYSLPWVTGTKPQGPVWSPDSRRIAFLWNDDGGNFYDVWIAAADKATPLRVTAMPRLDAGANPGKDIAKLEQVARAETDAGVSAVVWAPDGQSLVFIFQGELYRVTPGGTPQRLTALQNVEQCAAAPLSRVAPSGAPARIACVAGGALWVIGLDGGEPVEVYAPGAADVGVESFGWAPDGRHLSLIECDTRGVPSRGLPDYLAPETRLVMVKRAFPGEPSELRRVGVVGVQGGAVQWADLGPNLLDQIFAVSWSPDAATLLVDKSDLYIKDRRLILVDSRTGKARQLLEESDPNNVTAEWWSDWAPDGRGVYFISDRDEDYHVYYQALIGGPPRRITTGDHAVFDAVVSPAAKALFVVTNEGRAEERQVFRVPLKGGPALRVTVEPGAHKPVVAPNGRLIADLFSNDVTPPDLYMDPVAGQRVTGDRARSVGAALSAAPRQVTHSPLPEFRRYRWVAARYVTFPNVEDGTLLHARLTLPPDFDPTRHYPAILGSVYSNTVHNEWGGRIYHPTWGIDQFLAQQGFVIMNVDISGSSGHGKAFRQRIREDYGGVDVEDLYSGVRYLISQGYVDPHRVGIWGSSYGGLLTVMSLFTKPGVYKAGVAGAPATSLFHAETGEMRTMMDPRDHPAEYAQSSAFLKSAGLADHLLLIHGMRDDTVLFKDTVTLEQRLILQGNDVDFVPLPNAPHGWDTQGLAQTRFAFHKLYDYFERYLGPSATDPVTP